MARRYAADALSAVVPQRPQHRADDRVLAVCGFSGAGKTTLLELIIPQLTARGLRVSVVKHDAHGVQLDRPGKDSDRLFRAGASVHLRAPDQLFWREQAGPGSGLAAALQRLLADSDVVLVEGHKQTPLTKLWLSGPDNDPPPPGVSEVIATLARDDDRAALALPLILERLQRAWRSRPIIGGLLLAAASPILDDTGRCAAPIAGVADVLEPRVQRLVLLGEGRAPAELAELQRLPDPPDHSGPLASIAAAMRWAPGHAWLICACPAPSISDEAVAWLLAQRAPGRCAVLPMLATGAVEPLLAVYEPHARPLLESLVARELVALGDLGKESGVYRPTVPDELTGVWVRR